MRLTRDEILLIAIIFSALLIGAAAKHYRVTHPRVVPVLKPSAPPAASKKAAPAEE
jgi:hypothetical protein